MAAPAEEKQRYVLSYHNTLLRKDDVLLLNSGQWLNDQIIGFVFEYFEFDLFKTFSDIVTFVSPEVVQFIKFSEGAELSIFLEPLNLESKNFVFLVINDKSDSSTAGGSHWSLLVFQRHLNQFSHFDSMGGSNAWMAKDISKKIKPFLKVDVDCTFIKEDAPQQTNCYDCGVFVVCTAEQLCNQFFHGSTIPLKTAVTQQAVTSKRNELKALIVELSKKDSAAETR
ncbi:sentrin-specific protease 8-like [Amphiura filiformis]|uniref:sentrin-specific protease 8-like n=1 Tax=Amphiura filiformis TaxID=82378 RepID=UPI003B226254